MRLSSANDKLQALCDLAKFQVVELPAAVGIHVFLIEIAVSFPCKGNCLTYKPEPPCRLNPISQFGQSCEPF